MAVNCTHSYAVLHVSRATFEEIQKKLREAEYHHCFHSAPGEEPVIDMHGIALADETKFPDAPL